MAKLTHNILMMTMMTQLVMCQLGLEAQSQPKLALESRGHLGSGNSECPAEWRTPGVFIITPLPNKLGHVAKHLVNHTFCSIDRTRKLYLYLASIDMNHPLTRLELDKPPTIWTIVTAKATSRDSRGILWGLRHRSWRYTGYKRGFLLEKNRWRATVVGVGEGWNTTKVHQSVKNKRSRNKIELTEYKS